jgi:phage/plasmid-like protein (TIGR03299 family)
MAHEITASDGLVLHRERAWHGLGTVVEQAPTATEALKLAGLDWAVEQWPMTATDGQVRRVVESHVLNVRSDVKSDLGVVTSGYTPIQNAKLAELAQALAESGDTVRVESAGSIRGGRKVWFLLKGESFTVRSDDRMTPYILLANAHDGTQALRCIPTSVRVVCSNTLHLSLGRGSRIGYTFRHTSGIELKAEEIKRALGLYGKSLESTRTRIDALSAKDVKREDVQAFFVEAYSRDFGPIPTTPTTDAEKSARERAADAYRAYARRFDRERDIAGATAWNAFNAYSGWLQHERPVKVAAGRRAEARNEYRMLGDDAERTNAAFEQALAMV